jgi:hypothetical protein
MKNEKQIKQIIFFVFLIFVYGITLWLDLILNSRMVTSIFVGVLIGLLTTTLFKDEK